MRQKSFIVAIFVTLFILGIVAGVARAAYFAQQPPTDEAAQIKQTMIAHDAQYSQTITEANTRLEQANQALQQMQQQLDSQAYIAQVAAQPTSAPVSMNAAAPQPGVSSDEVTKTAIEATRGWVELDKSQPELVDYQGSAAYEVKLADGGSMYFDSQNGSLLYNSLTGSDKGVITEDQAAKAAQAYLKGGGVFKTVRATYNSKPAYKVIFDVGHRIYVGLGGDILDVSIFSVQVNYGGGGGHNAPPAPAAPAAPSHQEHEGGGND